MDTWPRTDRRMVSHSREHPKFSDKTIFFIRIYGNRIRGDVGLKIDKTRDRLGGQSGQWAVGGKIINYAESL